VNERYLRKVQKERHMSNIMIMILNNPIFKNLAEKDRKVMAKLIYKAEMIEVHVRDKSLARINVSFQDIINSINMSLDDLEVDVKYEDDDDFLDPDEDNFK
jgi:hypothetical protein